MKIVKIHGTSGSGKSSLVHNLMRDFGRTIVQKKHNSNRPEVYMTTIPGVNRPLYILGPYDTVCGGCDAVGAARQIELLREFAKQGDVVYESLLGSEYYGALGLASQPYGKDHIFAFLDTPIEVCIERVKARRLAAGNSKPLNETNTRNRVKKIEQLKAKLINMGRRVETLPWEAPDEAFRRLFVEIPSGLPHDIAVYGERK